MRIGDREIRADADVIVADGVEIKIKPRNMEVLVYLAERAGEVVQSGQLLDACWRFPTSDHAVHKAIADLRKVLGDDARNPTYIKTIPRRGYCVIAEVEGIGERGSQADSTNESIAVVPLVGHNTDEQTDYLGEGIAEALIGGLSHIEGLRVASAMASRRFKGDGVEIEEIGRALDVKHVLGGSVQKLNDRIRVNVSLSRISDGSNLWSRQFDGTLSDIFALQDEVAREVVAALKVKLTPERERKLVDVGTANIKAYNAYLLGSHESRRGTRRGVDKAIDHLNTAIALDPDFALPYRELFNCYWTLIAEMRVPERRRLVPIAERVLDEAVARGWEHPSPPMFLKQALLPERTPTQREQTRRALEKIQSMEVDWRHYELHLMSNCLCSAGLFGAAAAYEELYNARTDYRLGELPYRDTTLSHLWGALGRFDDIIDLWTRAIDLYGRPAAISSRAMMYSRTGRHDLAGKDLESIGNVWGKTNFPHLYDLYWRGNVPAARRVYDDLVHRPNFQRSFKFVAQFLMEDYEGGLDTFLADDPNRAPRIRAYIRWLLPSNIVHNVERHRRFIRLMTNLGLTDAWRAQLIDLANEASNFTGIRVDREQEDALTHGARA